MSTDIWGRPLHRCQYHPYICGAASSFPQRFSRPPCVNSRYPVRHPDTSGLIQLMKANTSRGARGMQVPTAGTMSDTRDISLRSITLLNSHAVFQSYSSVAKTRSTLSDSRKMSILRVSRKQITFNCLNLCQIVMYLFCIIGTVWRQQASLKRLRTFTRLHSATYHNVVTVFSSHLPRSLSHLPAVFVEGSIP
jgi:hypothetical protein